MLLKAIDPLLNPALVYTLRPGHGGEVRLIGAERHHSPHGCQIGRASSTARQWQAALAMPVLRLFGPRAHPDRVALARFGVTSIDASTIHSLQIMVTHGFRGQRKLQL
jgi:hypothetical protein